MTLDASAVSVGTYACRRVGILPLFELIKEGNSSKQQAMVGMNKPIA